MSAQFPERRAELKRGTIVGMGLSLMVVLTVVAGCASANREKPSQTVSQVDLERYMGKWYEIASLPAWFEKGCYCTTAEYKLAGDCVSVTNSCRKGSPLGELDVATAKAFPVSGSNNSQLKVQFQWPFKGDYWIIALDDDYEHALVGHPHKTYLWILSRTPYMDGDTYWNLVETARAKGYDVDRLRKTDQSCEMAF